MTTMTKHNPNAPSTNGKAPRQWVITEEQLTEILLQMQQDIREIKRLSARAAGYADPKALTP